MPLFQEKLDSLKNQSKEFDAVAELVQRYRALPAVVDNDYPEARHYYEGAVRGLITAFQVNGRFTDSPSGRLMREWEKRLEDIAFIIERVENRCMTADGPVKNTRREMTDDELVQIYEIAKMRGKR